MNSLHLDIPDSQLVLNAHDMFQKQIIAANFAIVDAINSTMDFDAPTAANLFGMSENDLKVVSQANKGALITALTIGLPIFSLRIATAAILATLTGANGSGMAFDMLLSTFESPPSLLSLGEPFHQQERVNVSEAMLDIQEGARRQIEKANQSVLDAVRGLQIFDDPLAPHLFDASPDVLRIISQLPRARTLELVLTGVPLFSVRSNWVSALLQNDDNSALAPISILLNSLGLAPFSVISA